MRSGLDWSEISAKFGFMAGSYVVVGSGDHHVIALHGWFGSALGWGHLTDYLNTAQFTYVFPDLRGYGSRMDEPGDFTMAEAAADAVELADRLGWERFSLVGVAPVPATGLPIGESEWALFASAARNVTSREMIVNYATGSRLTPAFVDLIVRHSRDNSTVEAFGAYLPTWAKADILARVKGNEVPVKVITGEYDPTQPAEFMEQAWLQVYPNSELEVLRGTGHYPMFETPVALAVSIEEFLARG